MTLCAGCGRPLTKDEIALTKKLVNRGAESFLCLSCLAEKFGVSEDLLKEKIGVATIVDTLVFGPALNFYLRHNMIPVPEGFAARLLCTVLGFLVWSLGIAIYMKAHLGAGPKDGLFVAFAKRKIPVALAKNSIEAVVCLIGWLFGGTVGIGTLICVFTMGSMIDIFFRIFRYDVNTVQNESLLDTARNLKMLCTKHKI